MFYPVFVLEVQFCEYLSARIFLQTSSAHGPETTYLSL